MKRFIQNTIKDLYYFLLKVSWFHFLSFLVVNYLALNVFFAGVYLVIGGIKGLESGSFINSFFFSIQTMSTIGYGAMHPVSTLANVVVTIEVMVGLIVMSLFTGLMFAKFSRPQSKVIFSRNAIIRSRNSLPYLIFRLANERENTLAHANIRVSLLKYETTVEGDTIRKFYDLKLERSSTPLFSLSWTVMHAIDESSPLFGMTSESIEKHNIWIAVSFTGHDDVLSRAIHRHHIYKAPDILFGHVFTDALVEDSKGQLYVDYGKFHNVDPIEPKT